MVDDERVNSWQREIIIFGITAQQYLVVENGSLAGKTERGPDCVWLLS